MARPSRLMATSSSTTAVFIRQPDELATIAMTRGLHQIRLRFLQATGVYEFYASWTPPGEQTNRRSRRSNCSSTNHLPSSCF